MDGHSRGDLERTEVWLYGGQEERGPLRWGGGVGGGGGGGFRKKEKNCPAHLGTSRDGRDARDGVGRRGEKGGAVKSENST